MLIAVLRGKSIYNDLYEKAKITMRSVFVLLTKSFISRKTKLTNLFYYKKKKKSLN